MLRALRIASTGMEAQSTKIDNISNNLANVNTTGYKRSRADFEDLLYQNLRAQGAANGEGIQAPVGLQVGYGVKTVSSSKQFNQGDFQNTGNPLDVAIEGNGFLQVVQPTGDIAFTRAGNLKINGEGQVVTSGGLPIEPAIVIPPDATNVTIGNDGRVTVTQGATAETNEVGQIQLASFVNAAGLKSIGGNMYQLTPTSGEPIVGVPGADGLGTISQGFLEGSNVNVVEEMIGLIVAQRSYETNSRVIQAADEMLQSTNNML
ncbi:MAG: flagellar basal-body rod protein FlgG [Myxococcota bacterium]